MNAPATAWPSGFANGFPDPPKNLLPGRVEGYPQGTQAAANDAERLLSTAEAWWDAKYYRDGDRFLRNRGVAGDLLDLRLGSSIAPNSNDPRYLAPEDQGYVYLPSVIGNYLSIPDAADLDITGDLDMRVLCALDDWTPSAYMSPLAKFNATGNQRSYAFSIKSGTAGDLRFAHSPDGATSISADSTAGVPVADGEPIWIRITLDVDDGAGNHVVTFYTSRTGAAWTQLGDPVVTAGTTSIFAGTSPVSIGSLGDGSTNRSNGRFYAAQIWNGIEENGGTTVLDIDCDAITSGSATSFTAVTGQTVTINRSTSGRKSVAVPSRGNRGGEVFLFGTDDYMEVVDNWQHQLLNFGQGDSFTVVCAARLFNWNTQPLLVKTASFATGTDPGYNMYLVSTPGLVMYIKDGLLASADQSNVGTVGSLTAYTSVRNTATDTLSAYVNGVVTFPATDTTSGSLSTTLGLRIGRQASTYANMELTSAAIFRRALSPAEIKTISDYFTGRSA